MKKKEKKKKSLLADVRAASSRETLLPTTFTIIYRDVFFDNANKCTHDFILQVGKKKKKKTTTKLFCSA